MKYIHIIWKKTLSLFSYKRLWLLLCLPVAFLLLAISKNTAFAEWYARYPYSFFSKIGNAVTGLLPFSLAEILLIFLCIAAPIVFIWFIVHFFRGKGRRGAILWKAILNLFCGTGILLLLFTLNCGINYNRFTFAETSGLTVKPSSKEELIELTVSLGEKLNELRPRLQEDNNGVMLSGFSSIQEQGTAARDAFNTLHMEYPLLSPGYSNPKGVMCSRLMSWCHITGVFFPFTYEANVNTDIPDYSIPSTMCHELVHLRGFMREDEANFIGYLACCRSESPEFQYSGYMLAFIHSSNSLYSADKNAYREICRTLNEGVQRDLSANSTYWKQFESPMEKIADSVNNAYLQSNGQKDGIKSYGRMVDLLLAEQRSKKGI